MPELPTQLIVPGGVATLPLGPSPARPHAYSGGVPLLVVGDTTGWVAVLGIPLSAKPGSSAILVRRAGGADAQVAYTIEAKQYAEQHLKVPQRTVDLSKEDMARYERERARQNEVTRHFQRALADQPCACSRPPPACVPARSVCAGCSTGKRAIRTAAWTSPLPPAHRWSRPRPDA